MKIANEKLKFQKTISSKIQKEINRSIVLNYLIENSNISRAKVARELKISAPTVSKIIDRLIVEGYVIEIGKVESTGGKRAKQLKFNSDIGYIISVDLGKNKIRLAKSDFDGNILEQHVGSKILINNKNLLNDVIEEISIFINKYTINDNNKAKSSIKAICLGVPASFDTETGEIKSAALFEGWNGLKLKEILTEKFNLPIIVDNCTKISTFGEYCVDENKKFKDMIYLEVGEGIGAGIIINNKIFRGSDNSAGEVGFIISGTENLYSNYESMGYMEKVASPICIENEIITAIKNGKKTLIKEIVSGKLNKIDSSIVFKAASCGDNLANEIIKKVVEHISIIIINLTLILNPQIIIIGGEICSLPDVENLIMKPLKKIIKRIVPFKLPEIKLSSLGNDAGIIGASFYAIDKLLTPYFPYSIYNK